MNHITSVVVHSNGGLANGTLVVPVHFSRGRRGRKEVKTTAGKTPPTIQLQRVPRVSKLMALAIRFRGYVDAGQVEDLAELAQLGQVTRARMTQIMNLLHLATDIQEELLDLPRIDRGRDRITERDLRPIAASVNWTTQRRQWRKVMRGATSDVQSEGNPPT